MTCTKASACSDMLEKGSTGQKQRPGPGFQTSVSGPSSSPNQLVMLANLSAVCFPGCSLKPSDQQCFFARAGREEHLGAFKTPRAQTLSQIN